MAKKYSKKLNIYAELFSISERFWLLQNVLTILSTTPNPVNTISLNIFQIHPLLPFLS